MKRIIMGVLLLLMAAMVGCGSGTGVLLTTVGSAVDGDFGDRVEFEVARISPFGGGVAYNGDKDQYAFSVYDQTTRPNEIIVVVKSKDIHFSPRDRDFLKIEGRLQESSVTPGSLFVWATSVEKAVVPAGW